MLDKESIKFLKKLKNAKGKELVGNDVYSAYNPEIAPHDFLTNLKDRGYIDISYIHRGNNEQIIWCKLKSESNNLIEEVARRRNAMIRDVIALIASGLALLISLLCD